MIVKKSMIGDTWKPCFLRIEPTKMKIYEKEGDAHSLMAISFKYDKLKFTMLKGNESFEIIVGANYKRLVFKSKDKELCSQFTSCILNRINSFEKDPNEKISTNPLMFDYISEEDFLEIAKVGDLLLFRNNAVMPRVTRFSTNSHFDHVALVIKKDYDPEIYFLQATGGGV